MGVHRFALVGVFGREAHVVQFAPVAGGRFDVAVADGVEAVGFDLTVEPHGILQRFGIARGAGVFREAVDGESEGVELFLGVERRAVGRERPVEAAVGAVVEAREQILFGACGLCEVGRTTRRAVSGREGPQDACVEHGPFRGVAQERAVAPHRSVPSAARFVGQTDPERKDVLVQDGFGLCAESLRVDRRVHVVSVGCFFSEFYRRRFRGFRGRLRGVRSRSPFLSPASSVPPHPVPDCGVEQVCSGAVPDRPGTDGPCRGFAAGLRGGPYPSGVCRLHLRRRTSKVGADRGRMPPGDAPAVIGGGVRAPGRSVPSGAR